MADQPAALKLMIADYAPVIEAETEVRQSNVVPREAGQGLQLATVVIGQVTDQPRAERQTQVAGPAGWSKLLQGCTQVLLHLRCGQVIDDLQQRACTKDAVATELVAPVRRVEQHRRAKGAHGLKPGDRISLVGQLVQPVRGSVSGHAVPAFASSLDIGALGSLPKCFWENATRSSTDSSRPSFFNWARCRSTMCARVVRPASLAI